MLLRFRVANHRSIRDEQELSLIAVPRQGERFETADGHIPRAVHVAAIYGPNASGKSSIISALHYFYIAIRDSYRRWDPAEEIPREPFILNKKSRDQPSLFELDFSLGNIRYNYGFELDNRRVRTEWLYSYPHGKRRVLYDRFPNGEYYFGRTLRGENSVTAKLTRDNALFLSVAAATSHGPLMAVYNYLTRRIFYADSTEDHEFERLLWLRRQLNDAEFARDVGDMVSLADLGLTGVEILNDPLAEENDPATISETKFEIRVAGNKYNRPPKGITDVLEQILGSQSKAEIALVHQAEDSSAGYHIPIQDESAGTRAWLSLAGRILFALRYGEALIVDEIDDSLHPRLSATLIHIFKDTTFNTRGAQLLFTTHDVSFLGSLLEEDLLARDEVWFTEKDRNGATTLYALEEFKPRKSENVERGYLQGRYGALPIIDANQIKRVLARIVSPPIHDKEQVESPSRNRKVANGGG